jgi:ribokinase
MVRRMAEPETSPGVDRPVVVVVGSVNADLVARLPRLPSPGETVLDGTFHRGGGGKGANQASAAARLGARAVLVGRVGNDDLGREARRDLEAAGVDVSFVAEGTEPTGVALILVGAGGENLIGVASGANMEVTAAQVVDAVGSVPGARAVVLAGLEVPDEAVFAAALTARERRFPFVLNPAPAKPVRPELVALCDVMTPNGTEVGALGFASPQELLAAGARAVVVTLGAGGVEVHRRGHPLVGVPAFPVEVVDTTGAGDAFSGALAWALAGGEELDSAIELACAAAALSTRALGARSAQPTADEVRALSRSR